MATKSAKEELSKKTLPRTYRENPFVVAAMIRGAVASVAIEHSPEEFTREMQDAMFEKLFIEAMTKEEQ